MWLDQLQRTLTNLLSSIASLFTKAACVMRIDDLRFGFGPRAPLLDEEAIRMPLMSPQETRHASDVHADRDSAVADNASRARHNDKQETIGMQNSSLSQDPPQNHDSRLAASAVQVPDDTSDYSATRLPKKPRVPISSHHEPEGGASSAGSDRRYSRVFLLDMPQFNDGTDGSPDNRRELNHDCSAEEDPIDNTPLGGGNHGSHVDGQQPDYGEQFLNLQSCQKADIAVILRPILPALFTLRATTAHSMPPYNPHVRTKSHSQVLKNRLPDIAHHITSYLEQGVPENMRGVVELRIYRYIADHYWPLPVTSSAHLDILRTVRNMNFHRTAYTQIAEAREAHEQWADEFRASQRQGFGDAAARCFAARNETTAGVGETNGTNLSSELIWDQEEVLQGDSHHSETSRPHPWDDTTDPLIAVAKSLMHDEESPMPKINKAPDVKRTIDPRLLHKVEYDIEEGEIEELGPYGYDPFSITSTHNQIDGDTTLLPPAIDNNSHYMNAWDDPEMYISRDSPPPLVPSNNDTNLNDDYKIAIRMAQDIWDDDDNTSTLRGGESRTPVDDAILTPEQQMKLDEEYAERLQNEEYGARTIHAGDATAAWENSKIVVGRRLGAVSQRLGAMANGAGNGGANLDQDVLFPGEEMDKDR
ncbi:hypothetical protein BKA63DRAFT_608203 [Paraphoma chrysanthemicola]|nr:hypothetical protein BKA63DRAFT_608203 [Paraphoma chrysanthemicola]